MTNSPLTVQELVVHVFAPLDGAQAAAAWEQVRAIWSRCNDLLGTTDPILGTGLKAILPPDPHAGASAEQALAGGQGRTGDSQVILRRLDDVLNLSVIIATPAGPRRRLIGSAAPAGWFEFDRWWGELAVDSTDKLLGVARVCQAKHAGDTPPLSTLAVAVRSEAPAGWSEPGWWNHGEFRSEGFAVWESCPPQDIRSDRQIVVLAPPDQDPQLIAWTWSRGDTVIPPLGRYLMHAAKIRCLVRQWRERRPLVDRLRQQTDDYLRQLLDDLNQPLAPSKLANIEAQLVMAVASIQEAHLSARISSEKMSSILARPLPGDRGLSEWFADELSNAMTHLSLTLQRVQQIRKIISIPPGPIALGSSPALPPTATPGPRDT